MKLQISEGDTVLCPHCEKEFYMEKFHEEEWDNFDRYFEHVSTCEGDGDWYEEDNG